MNCCFLSKPAVSPMSPVSENARLVGTIIPQLSMSIIAQLLLCVKHFLELQMCFFFGLGQLCTLGIAFQPTLLFAFQLVYNYRVIYLHYFHLTDEHMHLNLQLWCCVTKGTARVAFCLAECNDALCLLTKCVDFSYERKCPHGYID